MNTSEDVMVDECNLVVSLHHKVYCYILGLTLYNYVDGYSFA